MTCCHDILFILGNPFRLYPVSWAGMKTLNVRKGVDKGFSSFLCLIIVYGGKGAEDVSSVSF